MAVALMAGVGVTTPASAATPNAGNGYWMLGIDGVVYSFGQAPHCGHADPFYPYNYAVDIVPFPDNTGYWTVDDNYVDFHDCSGTFFSKGYIANEFFEGQLRAGETAVSLSATPDGKGYWVFSNLGRVLPFGTAQWYGDMSSVALNGQILDSVVTPSGRGYYMVAEDGGIFTFGDAKFSGSMGGKRLNKPVMSMAPDADGTGYWLVASDGGIFAFDAAFHGSMGAVRLNKPVSGMVASPTGGGYLMVAEDGGVFTFGDVPFHGSLGGRPPAIPIWSIAPMG
jgi:hypothetical protein